jgi:site-specific recombinase XerD
MNKERFIEFLDKKKKSERTINSYTDSVQQYEGYLFEHKKGKKIEKAGKKDLHDFEKWGEKNNVKINRCLWGIKEYYDFISKEKLKLEADAMIGERYLSQFKLKDFVGVKQSYIKKLAKEGITTAKEMLYAGLNKQKRRELSRNTGIPLEDVVELVKLSDQARIGGHKKVRARLYHEAGFDTIDKMAACDSEKMRKILADFIQKTGFKGIPPTPGEAQHTVTMAKYIKRLVHY